MSTKSKPKYRSNLERWLWENKMRPHELAKATGVSQAVISRLITGTYFAKNSGAIDAIKARTGLEKL